MQMNDANIPSRAIPKEADSKQVKMGKYAVISTMLDFHAYFSLCGYDIPSHKEWITLVVEPEVTVRGEMESGKDNLEALIRGALNYMWGSSLGDKGDTRYSVVVGKLGDNYCELSYAINLDNNAALQCMLTASVGSDSTTIFVTTDELCKLLDAIKIMQKDVNAAWEVELKHREEQARLRAEAENTILHKLKKIALTEITIVKKKQPAKK